MDPRQADSREYQRQAIDAEIKSLEESIPVLKHRRNALAPISSLPTEVITAIFLSVTVSAFKEADPQAWLRVTHVCHQWREIALNQPRFWSHVNFTALSPAGTAEILARAKTVPLYLEARVLGSDWDNARFSTFQEELQTRVSHICHLLISADLFDLRDTLERLVSPAPTLESLSLSSEGHCLQPALPETLFGGATPRLSCLELDNCDISWKSPLLKGLRYLDIRSPNANAVPRLSVWLDALDEMPQLTMLTLYEASPMATQFPFDVERTVTLPSLTHLNIADSPIDCVLALAHLDLPALSRLCLQINSLVRGGDMQDVLPYVVRHAHGSQDTQPLQSALIRSKGKHIDILLWPMPDIDVEVHDPPTLHGVMLPTRLAFSFKGRHSYGTRIEALSAAMAALPLDGLITFIAQDFISPPFERLPFEQFWFRNLPKWPLLQRIRLTPIVATKFTDWLLADNGGDENPLLPSLKELILVDTQLNENWTLDLCDVLMKRVEQGVPLELLDLRTCLPDPDNPGAVRLLSEIVVDVLGPEETVDARAEIRSMWDRLDRGPFFKREDSGEVNDSDISGDDEDDEE